MFDELREMNSEIQRKQEELDCLKAMATSMTATLGERVQTSPSDRLGNLMCKIIILENDIEEMIDTYADAKAAAKRKILTVSDAYQDVLYAHYIEFKTFREIADTQHCSVNAVKQKNKKGLKSLKNILTDTLISC